MRGLRRQHLRSTRKELAGRYYLFLSSHGSFRSYLKVKIEVDSDVYWWCDTGERQSRFHLVAGARLGQAKHELCGKGFGGCARGEAR